MDYKYLHQRTPFNHDVTAKTANARIAFLRLFALLMISVLFLITWLKAKQIEELTLVFAEEEPAHLLTEVTSGNELLDQPLELSIEDASDESSEESIPSPAAVELAEEIPAAPTPSWHETTIQKGDTLASVLGRYQIAPSDIDTISNLALVKKNLKKLQLGHSLKLLSDDKHQLEEFTYEINNRTVLLILRKSGRLQAEIQEQPVDTKTVFANGVVNQSLYQTGKSAGIPRQVMTQLTEIFGRQINFSKDLQPGDSFNLIYQKTTIGEETLNVGPIMAAEFTHKGKLYQAIRFELSKGEAHYYTPNGEGLERSFLRYPIKYARISSHFNLSRLHPILHTRRPHLGVDFAAPSGTPVKASGEGKITFAGRKSGYGNMVTIDHGQSITTIYAHLKKTATGIKTGKRIKRGDIIGYVGSTGLASGPHLHYEVRINNKPHNPLTVKLPQTNIIPREHKMAFNKLTKQLMSQLDTHQRTMLAEAKPAAQTVKKTPA